MERDRNKLNLFFGEHRPDTSYAVKTDRPGAARALFDHLRLYARRDVQSFARGNTAFDQGVPVITPSLGDEEYFRLSAASLLRHKPARKNPGIVHHQHIAGVETPFDVNECAVFYRA